MNWRELERLNRDGSSHCIGSRSADDSLATFALVGHPKGPRVISDAQKRRESRISPLTQLRLQHSSLMAETVFEPCFSSRSLKRSSA